MTERIPAYPSIFAWGHHALGPAADFLDRDVLVEEKVDGSQFSCAKTAAGDLVFRSKGVEVFPEAASRLFAATIAHLMSVSREIEPGWVLRGEALFAPRHNTVEYARVPRGHFLLFDVELRSTHFASPGQKAVIAERLGVELAPLLFSGRLTEPDLLRFLATPSALGGTVVEGIVIKPADYGLYGADKKVLMAKLVREDFKEENDRAFRAENPTQGDIIVRLTERYRVEARWRKAVEHLRDQGLIEGLPRDIGRILAEVRADLRREASDDIRDALYSHAFPHIERGVTRGLPEWYRAALVAVE